MWGIWCAESSSYVDEKCINNKKLKNLLQIDVLSSPQYSPIYYAFHFKTVLILSKIKSFAYESGVKKKFVVRCISKWMEMKKKSYLFHSTFSFLHDIELKIGYLFSNLIKKFRSTSLLNFDSHGEKPSILQENTYCLQLILHASIFYNFFFFFYKFAQKYQKKKHLKPVISKRT